MSIYYIRAFLLLMVSLMAVSAADQRNNIHQKQQEDPLGFFQYVHVPAYLQYEFGFNRGSPTHQISRHEQFKDGNFRSKIKWSDSFGGLGGHYFDYNHGSDSSVLPEYTAPDYQIPIYNPPLADSNPSATQDSQPIFDTLFRFPPKPNNNAQF